MQFLLLMVLATYLVVYNGGGLLVLCWHGTHNNCTLYYMRWKNQPVEKVFLYGSPDKFTRGPLSGRKNIIKSIYQSKPTETLRVQRTKKKKTVIQQMNSIFMHFFFSHIFVDIFSVFLSVSFSHVLRKRMRWRWIDIINW